MHNDDRRNDDTPDSQQHQNGDTDYNVGYGKPPKHKQFQRGQSGNPSGRPKRRQALPEDLAEELRASIKLTENSKRKTVSRQRAILKQLVSKSITGDLRAISMVLKTIKEMGDQNAPDPLGELLKHFDEIHRRDSDSS